MSKLTELIARKESILDLFKQKVIELTDLNTEISTEISTNTQVIDTLNKDNASLKALSNSVNGSITALNKILK